MRYVSRPPDRGFTLIELLVVILIVGILAAVALPTFLAHSDKAKGSASRQALTTGYQIAKSEWRAHEGYGTSAEIADAINDSERWAVTAASSASANSIPAGAPANALSVYVVGKDRLVLCSRARAAVVYCMGSDEAGGLTVAGGAGGGGWLLGPQDASAAVATHAYAVGADESAARAEILAGSATALWPR